MRSCSLSTRIERARPLLGTLVAVRVSAPTPRAAHRAIDRAFGAMSEIHALMSFQEGTSDVSRINRSALQAPVTVHAHTFRVLTWAARMAQISSGLFDVSIGGALVNWGTLPAPDADAVPDPNATFRDIELLPGSRVQLRRALWIDLSGIAKGYAVDRAVRVLRRYGIASACVNAGGDLRITGTELERVAIRTAHQHAGTRPIIEISEGALATSSGAPRYNVAAQTRTLIDAGTTASVVASRCIFADALTKVVLADAGSAAPILRRFNAAAYVHRTDYPDDGWRSVGELN
jgi:thiamine biosynthesis lipoprotein